MTGPGLPANGVTLTDVSQRADQGKFTTIDLDSKQEWSYRWDTSRIMDEIKYGTYLVYVSNEPADKSQPGGTNTYKTLEVYFAESTTSRVSSSGSGPTYTLNPEMHSSVEVSKIAITSPTPTPLTTPPIPVPITTPQPTTKAPLLPAAFILAVLLGACAVVMKMQ